MLQPGKVAIVDLPEPVCGPTEVVVAMRAVGLCGSDLSVYSGAIPVSTYPWVIGHEGGGEIIAVGEEVRDRYPGQLVVIEPNISCSHCAPCKAGQTSSCTNRRALGVNEAGIAAERVSAPAGFCWPVPDGTSSATIAGFEPSVVARATVRRIGVRAGDRCLVVGAGSQGLMLCLYLRSIGLHPFVVEPHEGRLKLAVQLGAQPHEQGLNGYPFVFETSGAHSAFRPALDAVGPGGQLVLIGQSSADVAITTRELVQRQLTVRGSLIYDHPEDFADAVRALEDGDTGIASVMQASYAPSDADRAFGEASEIAGKSWLDLTHWTQ